MFPSKAATDNRNTSHKVVLPFYIYAAVAFLSGTIMLLFSSDAFLQHYFHPRTLAITHIMALGWGTMMILGASHQLVPVLIEKKIFSETLAVICFVLAGTGIPLLIFGFLQFNFGWQAQWGGILINVAILVYLVNLALSMGGSKKENVHAVFVFTATLWLFITTLVGLFLIFNFTHNLLSFDSLHYLPLHAHLGIAGWFLLLVFGVGSRLIPMFLISKYDNPRMLWSVYALINAALILFTAIFMYRLNDASYLLPAALILASIILFATFCYRAYKNRLRRKVDDPMKLSLLAIGMMVIPVICLIFVAGLFVLSRGKQQVVLTYGFCIFFGWITAIILGMTFKTLPFILWNKTYHAKAGTGKTPNPKDLFSNTIFKWMSVLYICGFVLFGAGILSSEVLLMQVAAALLVIAAALYNVNILKMLTHKPKKI